MTGATSMFVHSMESVRSSPIVVLARSIALAPVLLLCACNPTCPNNSLMENGVCKPRCDQRRLLRLECRRS
jgi:hypothetical protein